MGQDREALGFEITGEHAADATSGSWSGRARRRASPRGFVTEKRDAATALLDSYRGTAAFWHASTCFADGFALTGALETGIDVEWRPAKPLRGGVKARV